MPNRTFVSEVGGATFTYTEFGDYTRRWAASFARIGVQRGELVAVMMPTCADGLAAWLGLSALGAVCVPFNTAYKGETLRYQLDNCAATRAVVAAQWLDTVANAAVDGRLDVVIVPDRDAIPHRGREFKVLTPSEFLVRDAGEQYIAEPQAWDTAAVVYTSGTTGNAKGVMIPWGQIRNMVVGADPFPLDESLVYYDPYPLFHLAGMTPAYSSAVGGGKVVLRNGFSTTAFWDDVTAHGCTRVTMFAATAHFLLQQTPSTHDTDNTLRHVLMVPTIPNVDEFIQRFGVQVSTLYGSTELGSPLFSPTDVTLEPGLCGQQRRGYQLRLVDSHDVEVPDGAVGELVIRPDEPWTMMTGYLRMPEATSEVNRNLWFHTGDAMRRDPNGLLYFVDRVKDSIRRRGENISSVVVEAEVQCHPDVGEVACVAAASPYGEDDVRIIVVPGSSRTIDPAELIEFLEDRMPRFMLPRYVDIVDRLPRTLTDRVRKDELRRRPIDDSVWDRERATVQPPAGRRPT